MKLPRWLTTKAQTLKLQPGRRNRSGWVPTKRRAYTEYDCRKMYWAALFKADKAMQVISTMDPRLRDLSREILDLRAEYITDWAMVWGTVLA